MSDEYLVDLQRTYGDKYDQFVQASDAPSYLKQHISLQKVLSEGVRGPSGLSALKPPFGPFATLNRLGWDSWEMVKVLIGEWNPWSMGYPL